MARNLCIGWNGYRRTLCRLLYVNWKAAHQEPRWPPHAKFHNGQSVMMGLIQGVLALVLLFEPGRLTLGRLLLAAIISSSYWLAAFGARVFPGTAWVDPEFEAATPKPLGLHNSVNRALLTSCWAAAFNNILKRP